MKKVLLLLSVGAILGCSGKSQNAGSKASALPVVQASSTATNPSPTAEPVTALPAVSEGSNHQHWHSEIVKDTLGNAVALKQVSSDGKFDLVVVLEGTHAFVSLANHAHWESVRHRAAQGKLMNLRVKFEDGEESRVVWDELGLGTPNLYSVVWSYPTRPDSTVGQMANSPSDFVGGDDLLIQEMTKHTTMLVEVEPNVTTQFDIHELAPAIHKARAPKAEPLLAATQTEAE